MLRALHANAYSIPRISRAGRACVARVCLYKQRRMQSTNTRPDETPLTRSTEEPKEHHNTLRPTEHPSKDSKSAKRKSQGQTPTDVLIEKILAQADELFGTDAPPSPTDSSSIELPTSKPSSRRTPTLPDLPSSSPPLPSASLPPSLHLSSPPPLLSLPPAPSSPPVSSPPPVSPSPPASSAPPPLPTKQVKGSGPRTRSGTWNALQSQVGNAVRKAPQNRHRFIQNFLFEFVRFGMDETVLKRRLLEEGFNEDEVEEKFNQYLPLAMKKFEFSPGWRKVHPNASGNTGVEQVNSAPKESESENGDEKGDEESSLWSDTAEVSEDQVGEGISQHPEPAVKKNKGKKSLAKKKAKVTQAEGVPGELENKEAEEESSLSSDIVKEKWETGWGDDELKPTQSSIKSTPGIFKQRKRPPTGPPSIPFEHQLSPLAYTRRIEGVLEPDKIERILHRIEPPTPQLPIAQLKHGLERVLFNPGVHWLRDPRSRVYNFDPYLQEIPPVTDFAFERLSGFVRSSMDQDLSVIARQQNKRFTGSTSSLSGMLCHIYFMISKEKFVDTATLSLKFQKESREFTPGQRMAATVDFIYKDGAYAINSTGERTLDSDKNILTWMGTMLEKYLTMPKEEFSKYRRSSEVSPPTENQDMREAFHFATSDNFVMRSQLDCFDPRLPGTGVFDIKTRACMPIRLDIMNFKENSGYVIRHQHGMYESFEREYYDLIRSAFLKYSFQVRIGNMDGVIVAYHNTEQIFGFQYIPLEEMDERLFGARHGVGDRLFKACVGVLENVAEEVVACFPGRSVKATFETLDEGNMNVWVEPLEWDKSEDRPIQQLLVETFNYLGNTPRHHRLAFRSLTSNWSVRWAISHLNASAEAMRAELQAARDRQFRAWATPTGVDPDDVEEWYQSLNFGGKVDESGTTTKGAGFDPVRFVKATSGLERLRRLAREGRKFTEQMRAEEADKPRQVLGPIGPLEQEVQ